MVDDVLLASTERHSTRSTYLYAAIGKTASAILKGTSPLPADDTLIKIEESIATGAGLTQVHALSCEAIVAFVFNRPSVRLLERLLKDEGRAPGTLVAAYYPLLLVWLICNLSDIDALPHPSFHLGTAETAVHQLRSYTESLPYSPNFRELFNGGSNFC